MMAWLRREAARIIEDVIEEHPILGWLLATGTLSFLIGCLLGFMLLCAGMPVAFALWVLS